MKNDIGHNLLCPATGYSLYKEILFSTTHIKISSNKLLDRGIKDDAIICDVKQIKSLNASSGVSMETPEVGSTNQLKTILKHSLQG
jgi:hypothetical protein